MSLENLQQEDTPVIDPNTPTEPPTPHEGSLLGGDGLTPPAEPVAPSLAPENVDGYEVEIDGFDYDEFKAIPENLEFLDRAHKAGLNNEQMNFLLGEYNDIIPRVLGANAEMDTESCTTALNEVWGGETQANIRFAVRAAQNAVNEGILTQEEINSAAFGNNPMVLKMAAYFGKQLGEDTPPNITQQSGSESVEQLMLSEAYNSASHPDHAQVAAKVSAYFKKNTPE